MNNFELYIYELREDVRKMKQRIEELESKVKKCEKELADKVDYRMMVTGDIDD